MQGNNVTYKIAFDQDSRGQFARNGTLDDSGGSAPVLPISYNDVFAISRDLGDIQSTQAPVVWAVGYTTDPAVKYIDLSGAPPTLRSPYYKIKYSNDEALASIDHISSRDHMSNIIVHNRSLTSSTTLQMHPQGLNNWIVLYSRMRPLCRICLETWSLSRSPKYTVVPS